MYKPLQTLNLCQYSNIHSRGYQMLFFIFYFILFISFYFLFFCAHTSQNSYFNTTNEHLLHFNNYLMVSTG